MARSRGDRAIPGGAISHLTCAFSLKIRDSRFFESVMSQIAIEVRGRSLTFRLSLVHSLGACDSDVSDVAYCERFGVALL